MNGVLQQTGGLVSNLGTTVKGTGLPGGLGVGVGGLVDGLGKTVASAGGLLNASRTIRIRSRPCSATPPMPWAR